MNRSICAVALVLAGLVCGQPIVAADPPAIEGDVVYGHKHGLAMTLDVFRPSEQPNGAGVVFVVSAGWTSRWLPPQQAVRIFRPFLEKGFTVFAVRHGSSPVFKVPDAVSDVRRSVRFLRRNAAKYGVEPERIGVFGFSTGGHLSLVLGTSGDDGEANARDPVLREPCRVAAVVAFFPPTDLRNWVDEESEYYRRFPALQFDRKLAEECSPLLHVTPDDAPTLLIHGDKDDVVPIAHSQQLEGAFRRHEVVSQMLTIEGAGHGFGGQDAQRAVTATIDWFETHLAK